MTTPVSCQAAIGRALLCFVVWAVLVGCHRQPATDSKQSASAQDQFLEFMNVGKNYLDKGEAQKAIEPFKKSVALNPTHPDAHLNLANSYLLAGQPDAALKHAQEALALDNNSAAAHYVSGCAQMRLSQFEPALQALQESEKLDPTVSAVEFQIGLAHQQLQRWEEAITAFQTAIDLEPEHLAAHYNLSQVLIRAGRTEEANQELERHRAIAAKNAGAASGPAAYEKCKHTQARAPFKLEQPTQEPIQVAFVDVTQAAFANAGPNEGFKGPAGVIDIGHDARNDLFVCEGNDGFRLLTNSNGTFHVAGDKIPGNPAVTFSRCLVGDLQNDPQNDRTEDVIMIGPKETRVFRFSGTSRISDVSQFSRLAELGAADGALADFDFTGKLDLVGVTQTNSVRLFRNLGNLTFKDNSATSGIPSTVTAPREVSIDDWNNDDLMDLFVTRRGQSPLLMVKLRGGPFAETNFPVQLPAADALTVGDVNNDLRTDLILATSNNIETVFGGLTNRSSFAHNIGPVHKLVLTDVDNDGWLDLIAAGNRLRLWRNGGALGFQDVTAKTGLDKLAIAAQDSVVPADFDLDGDTDLLLAGQKGIRLLRNDGGNANLQLKVRLFGNRSNPSGLGVRTEIAAGGLRLIRTVSQLPIEIGVGQHKSLDSLTARWFDLAIPLVDVKVEPTVLLESKELTLPTGSCPYLYAWDGATFRFVTDILGASPAGLPVAQGRYIESDPDEYVWIGDDTAFPPRGSEYVLQITEELREVLYLDEAKLVVVDHAPELEVHPTDKLLPAKPYPPSQLIAVGNPHPLRYAFRHDGLEVTPLLSANDGQVLSPTQLRAPQLRGLAQTHSVTLDFGQLQVDRPLVLVMTGWLRFGGGMANIGASHHPDLPFPFPTLAVETADGSWSPVDVAVGAPAGKTKTILVDLSGKLPGGSQRLRLTQAFEIHWDRIALLERIPTATPNITVLAPDKTDLHWRGYSQFKDLPWHVPLTPDYDKVSANANWLITPAGWCTRYGALNDLVAKRDDALVLLNGGDELTLRFAADRLPPKPPGARRQFFLYSVGWDKDADFHVARGTTVEPIPFHGMDDQKYAELKRPVINGDWWMKYNTRWVGPRTLRRHSF